MQNSNLHSLKQQDQMIPDDNFLFSNKLNKFNFELSENRSENLLSNLDNLKEQIPDEIVSSENLSSKTRKFKLVDFKPGIGLSMRKINNDGSLTKVVKITN